MSALKGEEGGERGRVLERGDPNPTQISPSSVVGEFRNERNPRPIDSARRRRWKEEKEKRKRRRRRGGGKKETRWEKESIEIKERKKKEEKIDSTIKSRRVPSIPC